MIVFSQPKLSKVILLVRVTNTSYQVSADDIKQGFQTRPEEHPFGLEPKLTDYKSALLPIRG